MLREWQVKKATLGEFEQQANTKKEAMQLLNERVEQFSKEYDPYRVYRGYGDVIAIVVAPRLNGGWSYGFLRRGDYKAQLLCLMNDEESTKVAAAAHVFQLYGDLDDAESIAWLKLTCRAMRIEHAVQRILDAERETKKLRDKMVADRR